MTILHPTRQPLGALHRHRDFNLLWLGEGVSLLGNATTVVLLPLLAVLSLHAGPGWMGVLTASAWLPWVLVGLPIGAWVDTRSPRAVMMTSDLAAAASLVSVPLAGLLGLLSLQQLAVVAFANGTCSVFFRAAYPALVRQVAPPEQQEQAFARLYGTESAMQVVGPGVGGLVAQLGSALWGLLLDAGTFLVSAACLSRISVTGEREPAPAEQPLRERIREGVDYLRHDRLLAFFTVVSGVSNFGLTGLSTLLVLFMVRDLGLSSAGVGVAMALGSVGGVVGAVVATRVSAATGSARALRWFQLLAGPPAFLVLLAGPGPEVAWLVSGIFVTGLGVVASNVIRGAWRNRYVPEQMLARQVTTAQVVNFGTMPLAAISAGLLGAGIGLRATILLMAMVHVAACLAIFWCPLRRLRDMPLPSDPEGHPELRQGP
jgi:predicted MFS family arabinose efflux permease